MSDKKKKIKPRHYSRQYAMQALYQWQFSKELTTDDLIGYIEEEHNMRAVDVAYFKALVRDTILHIDDIDKYIVAQINRDMSELNPVELSVLRVALCEFVYRPEVPYRVVINEALELTKTFGSNDGHRFVNGVLDALAAKTRAVEVSLKKN